MNRPYQVWLLFAVFLTLAVGGLGWLTRQTLELDRAQALARAQAEQDERVGLALWRMDAFLMPLLVQEASRPDFIYSANYLVATLKGGKESPQPTLSPVLEAPPDFVRLHFQLAADGRSSSPQVPRGEQRDWSLQQGIDQGRITAAQDRLAGLTRRVTYAALLPQLPELPPTPALPLESNPSELQNANNPPPSSQVVESFAQQQLANLSIANDFNSAGPLVGRATPRGGGDANQAVGPSQAAGDFGGLASNRLSPSQQQRNPSADLSSRNSVFQAYASKVSAENRQGAGNALVVAPLAQEGVSRPLWVGEELVLARRVERGGATFVQGCWLDWPALDERLRQEVADILPEVQLRPAAVDDVARSLATLPVKLVTPAIATVSTGWSPMQLALALAWVGLTIAALAAAVTLSSVIALSERRAAFVAAVTHELRTPLTTFRMYAEMLSGGMIPPGKQSSYLDTLRAEADRLSHLVDNVLQYARLERGRKHPPRETLAVGAVVDRVASRLITRAEQAGLALEITRAPSAVDARLTTDAAALEQILFNLIDNACKYAAGGADPRLHLEIDRGDREIVWRVRDHGPGISVEGQRRLFRPFSKTVQEAAVTAPGVGLGLALSRRLARELGGELRLERSDAEGSVFVLTLPS